MTKFSGSKRHPLRVNHAAPIRTHQKRALTHEGGAAYTRDAESDLFLLAATTLFLPASYRARLEDFVRSRQSRLRRIYLTLIYGFITFGAVRIAVYAVQGLHAL